MHGWQVFVHAAADTLSRPPREASSTTALSAHVTLFCVHTALKVILTYCRHPSLAGVGCGVAAWTHPVTPLLLLLQASLVSM
jgi:hypothetical protein